VVDTLSAAGYRPEIEPFVVGDVSSVNVLADSASSGSDLVIVGAHLDSVAAGPGVNDNASGVAALLAIAEELAALPAPDAVVRFAFWGAEEEGRRFGSGAYVDALPAEERDRIVAYLNVDMLASPNALRLVYAERAAAPGSETLTQLFGAHFDAAGLAWEPIDLDGGSDHGPFTAAGLPTGGLFTGGIEPVTGAQAARFGAVAGEPADPCSHRACDTIANVDLDTLAEMSRALAAVLVRLAYGPS